MHRRVLDDCGKQLCQTRFSAGSLQLMKIKESASKRRLLLFSFLFSPDSPGLDASCMGKRKGKRQPRVAVGRGKEDVALQWNLAPLDRVRVGKGR